MITHFMTGQSAMIRSSLELVTANAVSSLKPNGCTSVATLTETHHASALQRSLWLRPLNIAILSYSGWGICAMRWAAAFTMFRF